MKKNILFLLILNFLFSCSNIRDYKVKKDRYDYFQFDKAGKFNDHPIRNKKGELVFNQSEAQVALLSYESKAELSDKVLLNCRRDFHMARLYHEAIAQAKESNFDKALELLHWAKKRCEILPNISHYYYVEAYIAQEKNDDVKRNDFLNKFIHLSESIYPKSFYQEDYIETEPFDLYHLYKKAAKEAVENNSKIELILTKDRKFEIARYNSYYNALMPGFRNDAPSIGILSPEFSWRFGLGLSMAYQFNLKEYGEFIPAILINEFYSLKYLYYRKSIYQNASRRHQMNFVLSAFEWKDIDLDYTDWGRVEEVDIQDSGVGYFGGIGGTFQINNFWSFMYQGKLVNKKDEIEFKSTSLLGASLMDKLIVQVGVLDGNSVVAVKRGNYYYMLDFTNRGFVISMLTGFGY